MTEKKFQLRTKTYPQVDKVNYPPLKWLVEDLISEKTITLLGGKPKSYKSFLALNLSLCVGTGTTFLGKYPTRKSRVLYLNLEEHERFAQDRIRKLAKGLGLKKLPSNCMMSCIPLLKVDKKEHRKELERIIKKHKPDLVIIDCFRSLIRGDENTSEYSRKVFDEWLKPLIKKYGLSFLVIHHFRKGFGLKSPNDLIDEFRGSSDIGASVDTLLAVRKSKTENLIIFEQAGFRYRRTEEKQAIVVDATDDSIAFTIQAYDETLFEASCEREILLWATENKKLVFTTKDIMLGVKMFSRATKHSALKNLVDNGKLVKQKRGVYEVPQTVLDVFKSNKSSKSNVVGLVGLTESKGDGK